MNFGTSVVRLSKIVVTGGLALWASLVALGNVLDYESNLAFVRHVLAMDTVFPDTTLKSRAITDPTLQEAAFVVIVGAEALIALGFLVASAAMGAAFRAGTAAFRRAKAWTALPVALAFALWFVGFLAIAGEWFVMWQSPTWNAQATSFRIVLTILAAGVWVLMDVEGA